MRFARMSPRQSRQKSVSAFGGGLNREEPAELIGDDQLAGCRNMYFEAGELVTRPGFHTGAAKVTRQAAEGDLPEEIARFTAADGRFCFVKTPRNTYVWNREGMLIGSWTHAYGKTCEAGFFADGGADTVLFFGSYSNGAAQITQINLTDGQATIEEDIGVYTPTAFINARPSPTLFSLASGGVPYEGYNLLSAGFKSLWTSDGEGLYYSFPIRIVPPASLTYTDEDGAVKTWEILQGETASGWESVKLNGVTRTLRLGYNHFNNCLWLEERVADTYTPVALPEAGFADNVSVTATRDGWTADTAADVYGMGFSVWFGGTGSGTGGGTRLFVSGNGAARNLVRYSDVNEPTFFPDNNFFYVGAESEPVTAFGKQGGCLMIFKPHELYACEYAWSGVSGEDVAAGVVPAVTSDAYFPLRQLHGGIGCDCPATVQLCGNHLVWANAAEGRVYALSGLLGDTERQVWDISRAIGSDLKKELTAAASAAVWENRYLLLCGRDTPTVLGKTLPREIYLFDCSRIGGPIPWYRWEFNIPLTFYGDIYGVNRVALMGKGESVLLMAVYHVPSNDFFVPYSIGGELDEGVAYDGSTVSLSDGKPVCGDFTTKEYAFDLPQFDKTVEGLLLQMSGEGEAVFSWHTDKGEYPARYGVRVASDRPRPLQLPYRVSRVRTAGLKAEFTGQIGVGGSVWQFRKLGEVK